MTEEEAKTQQCIGPRNCGVVIQTGSLNPDNFPRFCIGSRCKMAWRWGTRIEHGRDVVTGEDRKIVFTPESQQDGYCGLAGKP